MSSTNYELRETPLEQPERRLLYFTCPACGSCRLQEIAHGLWSISEIKAVSTNGEIEYGACEIDGGNKRTFRCGKCGYEIEGDDQNYIEDGQSLADWLITQSAKTRKV